MTGDHRFAIDTVAFISYHYELFNDDPNLISKRARDIITKGFDPSSNIKLIIPSVVFMEIYKKFLTSPEFALKFKYEIFHQVSESPDIEIKPIERELLQSFLQIDDDIVKLEHNDKLILAAAMHLECPLITNDPKIIDYVKKHPVIPEVIT